MLTIIVNFPFPFSLNPHCLTSAETYLLSETCAPALPHCSPVLFTASRCLSPFASFHLHWTSKKKAPGKKENPYLRSFILQASLPADCCSLQRVMQKHNLKLSLLPQTVLCALIIFGSFSSYP